MKIIGSLIVFFSMGASAGLGDQQDSLAHDRQAFRAKAPVAMQTVGPYTVSTITTDANTVREYISSSGKIFAVSWRGIVKPDLSVLLGSYYSEFQAAKAAARQSLDRRPVRYRTSHMVLQAAGHVRDMRGRAYLPDELPEGFTVRDIK